MVPFWFPLDQDENGHPQKKQARVDSGGGQAVCFLFCCFLGQHAAEAGDQEQAEHSDPARPGRGHPLGGACDTGSPGWEFPVFCYSFSLRWLLSIGVVPSFGNLEHTNKTCDTQRKIKSCTPYAPFRCCKSTLLLCSVTHSHLQPAFQTTK